VLWRLLLSDPLDGPSNMALDDALMARARRTGEAVLRTYAWSTPTLSFGRNQRALGFYDAAMLAAACVEVVRRPTGGRALLHQHEVTYSVTAPVAAADGGKRLYARINGMLASALSTLGVQVEIAAPTARTPAPAGLPCFAEPAAGELVHDGRKLVGSAQYHEDGAVLQHGSILIDDDQSRLPALMTARPAAVRSPATLRAVLGRAPSVAEVSAALAGSLSQLGPVDARPLMLDPGTRDEMDRRIAHYRDPAWTWRR